MTEYTTECIKYCFLNNLILCHAVSNEFNPHLVTVFLKAPPPPGASVSFVVSVRLSIPPAQRGFVKFYIGFFFQSVKNIKVCLKSDRW